MPIREGQTVFPWPGIESPRTRQAGNEGWPEGARDQARVKIAPRVSHPLAGVTPASCSRRRTRCCHLPRTGIRRKCLQLTGRDSAPC